jgi:hypothetical protein
MLQKSNKNTLVAMYHGIKSEKEGIVVYELVDEVKNNKGNP